MRTTSAIIFLASILVPFATANLHTGGICVTNQGGQNAYDHGATEKACAAYKGRNTGDKQWDKCPDCTMKVVGNLNLCQSNGNHIGGDQLEDYCKHYGASGSLAN